MENKEFYRILGVSKDADQKEIRKAYRTLARKYHPDVNPNDPEAERKFKEIGEAYAVLSDPEKRKKYDRFGAQWEQYEKAGVNPDDFAWNVGGSGNERYGPGAYTYSYGDPEDLQGMFGGGFADIFGSMFSQEGRAGHRRSGGPSRRPRDMETDVQLSLEEAFHGTTRMLEMPDGRRIEVRIPAGVDTGSRVRAGGAGAKGQANVYLRVAVTPHPRFRREGADLYVPVTVDLYTAVLGGEVTVPTLERPVALKIPAGTQNGRHIRLRGLGMPHLREPNKRGDLYAEVNVKMPADISPQERRLFEELREMQAA